MLPICFELFHQLNEVHMSCIIELPIFLRHQISNQIIIDTVFLRTVPLYSLISSITGLGFQQTLINLSILAHDT